MPRLWIAPLSLLCCAVAFGQASEYNEIYKNPEGKLFSRKPNAFLVEVTRTRKPGKALDVGMGQGRNSIYLARRGWDVTGFDASDEGVRIARGEAARLAIKLSARVATFDEFDFGENAWDLIVLMYVTAKEIAPKIVRALKPGLFADNELLTLFPGLRVLRYEDFWAVPDWQAEGLQERLVHLIAEKPSVPEPGCLWKGKLVQERGDVCWDHAVRFRCVDAGWVFTHEGCK
jgi:SAM-dependent methyltransferase